MPHSIRWKIVARLHNDKPKENTMNMKLLGMAILATLAIPVFADEAQLLEESRGIAMKMPPKLLEMLQAEIKKSGLAEAIGVCREKAPQMANKLSEQTGWAIRRVSLKNRNPKAVPDAWEKAVLEDFERKVAAGEKPAALEREKSLSKATRSTTAI